MEIKVSFDREELKAWLNEDCEIACEYCPIEGYMCDKLLSVAWNEECEKIWGDDENNK